MGFRGGGQFDPPLTSISWFSSTPAEIEIFILKKWVFPTFFFIKWTIYWTYNFTELNKRFYRMIVHWENERNWWKINDIFENKRIFLTIEKITERNRSFTNDERKKWKNRTHLSLDIPSPFKLRILSLCIIT